VHSGNLIVTPRITHYIHGSHFPIRKRCILRKIGDVKKQPIRIRSKQRTGGTVRNLYIGCTAFSLLLFYGKIEACFTILHMWLSSLIKSEPINRCLPDSVWTSYHYRSPRLSTF
jgi:hypothetical protein